MEICRRKFPGGIGRPAVPGRAARLKVLRPDVHISGWDSDSGAAPELRYSLRGLARRAGALYIFYFISGPGDLIAFVLFSGLGEIARERRRGLENIHAFVFGKFYGVEDLRIQNLCNFI